MGLKTALRRLLPASKAAVSALSQRQQEGEERLLALSKQTRDKVKASNEKLRAANAKLTAANRKISESGKQLRALQTSVAVLQRQQASAAAALEKSIERLAHTTARVERLCEKTDAKAQKQLQRSSLSLGFEKEAVWAQVFNSAVVATPWAREMPLWPGRFSVGYGYLFVLFRTLSTLRPQRILDIGLGITTRFLGGYVTGEPQARYTVVENNEAWISFFSKAEPLPPNADMLHLPLTCGPHREEANVMMYQGFAQALSGRQFDLISIDGPFGGKDMGQERVYSRVDILSILPDCLAPSFVILIDDYHRKGEQNMVAEIEALLAQHGIESLGKVYEGTKKFYVLVSPDNAFLLTL